ncbi:MAG: hypothetical protein IJM24_01395 [Clostridia bacterium]|nr:hypothetical protein [Clostridia bacterium]
MRSAAPFCLIRGRDYTLDEVGRTFLPDQRHDFTLDEVGRAFLPDQRPDFTGRSAFSLIF